MSRIMTNQELQAKKLVARLLGQDAAVDDETAVRLKEFLKTKLSPGDHAQVCDMLEAAGEPDVEAQDEPPPDDVELPKNATARLGGAAADAAFRSRYPGLAHVRIDTSGLQPKRAVRQAADVASFNARFPGLAKIRQA